MRHKWYNQPVPAAMAVKQVHGVLVTRDGRVLVRRKNGESRLTGGRPENEETWEETLCREALEESSVCLGDMEYLGYQVPEGEDYAQVRMVALIEEILPAKPDPDRDNNWIYGRELMPVSEARKCFGQSFGEIGEILIDRAAEVAKSRQWFVSKNSLKEILNLESKD